MSTGGFAAVVFDCDGTLIDSEALSSEVMRTVLAEDGHTATASDHVAVLGRAWPHTRVHLAQRFGYDDAGLAAYLRRYRAVFDARIAALPVFADARQTLTDVRARGVPTAVCTSSRRAYLEAVLTAHGLWNEFAASVAQEDTDEHKPHPAPYLTAAERLGVDPSRCVVVEDTPPGVAAAKAAGMTVVAVDRGMGLDLCAADRVVTRITAAALQG